MDWPALDSIVFAAPKALLLADACAVAALIAGAWLGKRHPRRVRLAGAALRFCAILLVGLTLASPSVEAVSETRFEPRGIWTLALDQSAPAGSAMVFRESPYEFAARVRNALVKGTPPAQAQVFGAREAALEASALITALGVPCTAHFEKKDGAHEYTLGEIRAPLTLQPGEPLDGAVETFGQADLPAGSKLVLTVDGKVHGPLKNARLPNLSLQPGRHVLTIDRVDATGRVVQRVGHVLRVGAKPRLLALGFDESEFAKLEPLATKFERERIEPRMLTAQKLREVEVVFMTVACGVSVSSAQARELAQFVANGGGLYVTADGAERTNRAYLESGFRDLLPVRLLEQRQEKPPDPPVELEIGKAEVAAVSLAFVVDRSRSMEAAVGAGSTRWRIAVEAIRQALGKLDPWDRAGVLSFTLSRQWRPRPKVIAPFDRELIAKDLIALRDDDKFDKMGYNTDIYAAVSEAIEVMSQERSAVKVIVVLTDGGDKDNDDGTVRNHHELAELAISKSINIVALGIGDGFIGDQPEVYAARKVIENLATKTQFAKIASDADAAKSAPVVFVNAVEFAYQAYDAEMQRRQREKEKRPIDTPKDPKIDVLEGKFALSLTPVGEQLFGQRALPDPAPRLLKYARCQLRRDSAMALSFAPGEPGGPEQAQPVALALSSFGLGRVAFWASGSDAASLGDVARWEEYPRLVAQTLRWLVPREDPQPRLVGGASTQRIGLIDPIEGAAYLLRVADRDIALRLSESELLPVDGPLPEGDAEIVEKVGNQQRVIGDVFLALGPAAQSRQSPVHEQHSQSPLQSRPVETQVRRERAELPIIACLTLMLILMPFERLIRRRS